MSILINNLTVTFKNDVTAIHHGNLEIPNGIFGLLGENGAGKTTLMRVLATVLAPNSGRKKLRRNPEKNRLSATGNRLVSRSYGAGMPGIYGSFIGNSPKRMQGEDSVLSGKNRTYRTPQEKDETAFRRNEEESRAYTSAFK